MLFYIYFKYIFFMNKKYFTVYLEIPEVRLYLDEQILIIIRY